MKTDKDFFPVEIAHALTRAERKKIIPVGYAKGFLADIMQTPPTLHPYLPLLARATEWKAGSVAPIIWTFRDRFLRDLANRTADWVTKQWQAVGYDNHYVSHLLNNG
jgi:hypothetical protein